MKFAFLLCIGLLFAHDYFISVCDIEYNSSDKAIEIAIKMTTHDLEDAIGLHHLGTEKETKDADDKILIYLKNHFSISCDEQLGELEWVGKQVELEDMWVYVQITDVRSFKNLKVFNDILCAHFEEQQNRVNLKYPGIKAQGTVLSRNNTEYIFRVEE